MLRTLTLIVALVLPGAALACQPLPLGSQFDAELPRDGSHNPALFNLAVLHAVNTARCNADLPLLAVEPGLNNAAQKHSDDMVRLGFFDHASPVPGRETLVARVQAEGLQPNRVAENIGQDYMVQYEQGRDYRVLDAAACRFTYERGVGLTDRAQGLVGRAPSEIPRQTYASAGRSLVEGWLASSEHRSNLLDPAFSRHGAGFAVTEEQTLCGRLIATQVLLQ